MEESKSTALVVRNMSDLNNALVSNRDKAHILTPFTQLMFEEDIFAPGFKPSLRTITISTTTRKEKEKDVYVDGEVYDSWEKPGEVALTKLALDKLAQVAGIEWVHVYRVQDTGDDPLKCHYYAEGRMRLIDGTFHYMPGNKSIDLNDGSPEAMAMSKKPAQLAGARKNIAALAESKAKNRVIRALLGLKQSYRPDELKKPFLVMKIVPDMADPEVRKMVQAQMLGMEKYLFAPQAAPQLEEANTSATNDLQLGDVPGDKKLGPGEPGPIIDVESKEVKETASNPAAEARAKKIVDIEKLYFIKTQAGKRDPGKLPLKELTDEALDKIFKLLSDQPSIRKSEEEELI
jgi:hypothetical protein